MKWFGSSWGAPICKDVQHADTPEGICIQCEANIQPTDAGFLVPYTGPELDNEIKINDVPHLIYHLNCFFSAIGVKR